ncbi:MAG: hypothetical protein AB8H80_09875 [Planctomycetota bacterium]
MKTTFRLASVMGALLIAFSPPATAQRRAAKGGGIGVRTEPTAAGVSWFGTWEGALAEAKRVNRPILLMSAAPACSQVPGVW